MALITEKEAWEYLGFFDEPDEVTLRTIRRTIKTAEKYLIGATGYQIRPENNDPRAVELGLMAFGFLYDNRDLNGKGSGTINRMTQSLLMQLKFEYEQIQQQNAVTSEEFIALSEQVIALREKGETTAQTLNETTERVDEAVEAIGNLQGQETALEDRTAKLEKWKSDTEAGRTSVLVEVS